MTDRLALRSVVRFLGWATVANGLGYLTILALVVGIAGKTGGSVDPVVAALIGGAVVIVTTPATALGTLLLAPSLGRPPTDPVPVTTAPGDVLAVETAE